MNELEYQKRKTKEEINELLRDYEPSFYAVNTQDDEELFILSCLKKILKELVKCQK